METSNGGGSTISWGEAVRAYLDRGMERERLAPTTRQDRRLILRHAVVYFGPTTPLIGIGVRSLADWWRSEVERRGRSEKTGRNHLEALAAVFRDARDHLLDPNPALTFLSQRRAEARSTKATRGRYRPRPIENPRALGALVEAANQAKLGLRASFLCALDAGLRKGEIAGLRWEDVQWGQTWSDAPTIGNRQRHLVIRQSRPRGLAPEEPKSGRPRRVGLSRRLRSALRDFWSVSGLPDAGLIFPELRPVDFWRDIRRLCDAAGIEPRPPKDLRDTFASWLLSLGIPIAYVSRQLGHSSIRTTEQHYAMWIPDGDWLQPPVLDPGDLPADLLARVPELCDGA